MDKRCSKDMMVEVCQLMVQLRDDHVHLGRNIMAAGALAEIALQRSAVELQEAGLAPENLERPIADLKLSVRSSKSLNRQNISTLGDLIRHSAEDLLECRNFGDTCLLEVREKLAVFGMKLRAE